MITTETRRAHLRDGAKPVPMSSKIGVAASPGSPTDRPSDSDSESSGEYSKGTKVTSDSSLSEHPSIDSPKSPLFPPPRARSQSQGSSSTERPGRVNKSSSAWYELDIAIVVALASPVANWVTGGDHIKNGLLLLLLLFYLHQIIEVPWTLYNQARARRSSNSPSASDSHTQLRKAASSRLHTLEMFYFTLTLASPILGATLLRTFAHYIAGSADVISWFSTGLFVLATSIRPWKHLLERCAAKAEELHDVVHYPPEVQPSSSETRVFEERLKVLEKSITRVADLERSLKELKNTIAGVEEDTDESLVSLEKTVKRHSKRIAQLEEQPVVQRCNHTCFNPTPTTLYAWISSFVGLGPPPAQQREQTRTSPLTSPSFNLKRFPSRATLETIPEDEMNATFSYIETEPYLDHSKGDSVWMMLAAAPLRLVRYVSLAPFKLVGMIVVHLLGGPSTR